MTDPLHLVVVHFHLRPGGVRRVIELALPAVAKELGLRKITLATGEAAPAGWIAGLRKKLRGVELREDVRPALGYTSEQKIGAPSLRAQLARSMRELLGDADAVWMHNPSLARNVPLVEALDRAAARRGVPCVFHHHDFWFDGRWPRWQELKKLGYRSLDAAARAVFPSAPAHAAINRLDYERLAAGFGTRAAWMPNPAQSAKRVARADERAAAKWLREELGDSAPVWIFPTRFLRRKNLAEAVLLTRWLRPGAWMVTTAAVSSEDEQEYARRLRAASAAGGWKARFGLLAREGVPDVGAVVAASEAVLLTSVQEGFGLPYLEAVATGRPLIARRLPNVMPDLRRLGFKLPHLYDEVWVDPACLDFRAERRRQERAWNRWRKSLPASARALTTPPAILTGDDSSPVAFSRLTLDGQLDVLAQPPAQTWQASRRWNRAVTKIEKALAGEGLDAGTWPEKASEALGVEAYARRFRQAIETAAGPAGHADVAAMQRAFIEQRLGRDFIFPILIE